MPDFVDVSNAADNPAQGGSHAFRFHGTGREYFPIWIVNLLLTIVTLGIYSPWAKVRSQRYFHEATELAGARFGYHARPLSILIGRIIVLVLFVPYAILAKIQSPYALVYVPVLLVAGPWIIVKALRFRLRVTSYRGVRFSFSHEPGVMAGAYINFLGLPILGGLTLGLLYPYVLHQQYRWIADNSRYGAMPLRMAPAVGRFYLLSLILVAAILLFGGGIAAIIFSIAQAAKTTGDLSSAHYATFLLIPVVYAALFLVALLVTLWLAKTVVQRLSLADVTLSASWQLGPVLWLYVSNGLLLVFTLGFAYPWVRCRTARYVLEHLTVHAPTGLDSFVAGAQSETGAFGDQAAAFFDIDVGIGF
ncbi:YjgN family protein [Nitrospirillum sp. BR 11164]|uniref:YjgN family protein n=1 Tax=Nitrospirillum sp. BR 11164 TaxID=3104324 RepID=UPI002AFFA1AE|nr:YjgN family protein [Nitrospirillum sp. BR 11164]MEA1650252.1 YjgN family protein [Nitrospirillum sp. BR 11164]